MSRQNQFSFCFAAINYLPISAIIDGGGKSLHVWVKVAGVRSSDQWESEMDQELYDKRMIPKGIDPSCKNPAQLSRLPGHYREGKNLQRWLYVNP